MLTVQDQVSILVHLSRADNVVAESEVELIHYLGERLKVPHDEIEDLISNPRPVPNLKNVPEDERFDYLYNIIQLMKIDGKVTQSEIQFCEKVAIRLGYLPGVVADMSAYIYSDPKITTKRSFLKKIADGHKTKK
ncbi:MAG: TerB family tellurite resistance protein [Cyclobacteriaceae bacterium]